MLTISLIPSQCLRLLPRFCLLPYPFYMIFVEINLSTQFNLPMILLYTLLIMTLSDYRIHLTVILIYSPTISADGDFFSNENKTEIINPAGFVREVPDFGLFLNEWWKSLTVHQLIPQVKTRFVGAILNRNNRFVGHIDHALGRARRSFYALLPILRSPLIDHSTRVSIYKSRIRPYICITYMGLSCMSHRPPDNASSLIWKNNFAGCCWCSEKCRILPFNQ